MYMHTLHKMSNRLSLYLILALCEWHRISKQFSHTLEEGAKQAVNTRCFKTIASSTVDSLSRNLDNSFITTVCISVKWQPR